MNLLLPGAGRAGSPPTSGTPARAREPRPATKGGAAAARRLDLQGLRGVAVLLVALDHANVPFLKGGYVGVDVFFVLSGFFITGVLFREGFGREGEGLGAISIRNFYARRVRRILPAACLTLLVSSIAVYIVYDVYRADFLQTKVVLEDAFAAALFFANFHFVSTATNYFAQATATMPSPFTHFWSLSIEEQFYFVWPSLLAGTFLLCRHRSRRARSAELSEEESRALVDRQRRRATWAVGGLITLGCGLSLAYSIHETAHNADAAYFLTPARVWELGLGAGIALLTVRTPALPRPIRTPLTWIGAAMIGVAAVVYSSGTPFPGDAALLPVLGAGLLIIGGRNGTGLGADRVLTAKPLTYVGDRSYTFYLWHYPVLIITWQAFGHVLGVVDNLGLLAGAFLLSMFTYTLYENPLRYSRWLRGWHTAAMVPVSIGAAVAAVLVPLAVFEGSLAAESAAAKRAPIAAMRPTAGQAAPTSLPSATPVPAVAAAARAARRSAPLPKDFVPSDQQLEQENSYIGYGMPRHCQPGFGPGTTSTICRLGDPKSKHVVAMVGDSHAGMWMPALIADGKRQHFAVVPLDKPGCILSAIHRNTKSWPCANWYQWALTQDRKLHPTATIVSFQMTAAMQSHASSTTRRLEAVLGQVTHGVLLADPPGQDKQPSSCVSQNDTTLKTCSSPLPSGYRPLMRALARMAAQTHHPAIPTVQWFCADRLCPMVIDHTLTLRDESHLTMQYSERMAPLLGDVLKPILAKLEKHGG